MTTKVVSLTPLRVKPGACLARTVLRTDGKVLLAAGTELSREHLTHLFERGIEIVYIEIEDTRDENTRASDLAKVEARISHLFRGPSNAVRDELLAAVLAYRKQGAE